MQLESPTLKLNKYLLSIHSEADVITNSSSELFMVTNIQSEQNCRDVIQSILNEDDIDFKYILTFNDAIDLVESVPHYYNISNVINVLFPGANLCVDKYVHPEIDKNEKWDSISDKLNQSENDFYKNLKKLIHNNRKKLQPLFRPCITIKVWCDEGSEFDEIFNQLGGCVCGGF